MREMRLTWGECVTAAVVLLVWGGMALALVDRETLLFSGGGSMAVESLLRDPELFRVRRMGIYEGAARVGWTESRLERLDHARFVMTSKTEAQLRLLARLSLPVTVDSETVLSRAGVPETLTMKLSAGSRGLDVLVAGVRRGQAMALTVTHNGQVLAEEEVPLPAGSSFDSGLLPLGDMPGLSIGRTWTVNHVNPITRKTERGTAEVISMEPVEIGGELQNAYRVEVTFPGSGFMRPVAHIGTDGRLLRLSGIANYVFIREEADDPH